MKTVIEMAREAGIDDWWDSGSEWRETFNAHIERFAALVAAAERDKWMERTAILIRGEREACAKECKFGRSSADIEQAIRARGENT